MNPSVLLKFFTFATELEKFKKLERFRGQCYWKDYPEPKEYDTDASHTWRLAMLVMMFSSRLSQPFDLEKALKMALIHDLPEIIIGDTSPLGENGSGQDSHAFNQGKANEKQEKEKIAAKTLFKILPEREAKEFFDLWIDYEIQKSFEAKVVKSLDKIEAMMQVQEYRQGHFFEKHLEFNMLYGLRGSDVDPAIEAYGKMIADNMQKSFREFA